MWKKAWAWFKQEGSKRKIAAAIAVATGIVAQIAPGSPWIDLLVKIGAIVGGGGFLHAGVRAVLGTPTEPEVKP